MTVACLLGQRCHARDAARTRLWVLCGWTRCAVARRLGRTRSHLTRIGGGAERELSGDSTTRATPIYAPDRAALDAGSAVALKPEGGQCVVGKGDERNEV